MDRGPAIASVRDDLSAPGDGCNRTVSPNLAHTRIRAIRDIEIAGRVERDAEDGSKLCFRRRSSIARVSRAACACHSRHDPVAILFEHTRETRVEINIASGIGGYTKSFSD